MLIIWPLNLILSFDERVRVVIINVIADIANITLNLINFLSKNNNINKEQNDVFIKLDLSPVIKEAINIINSINNANNFNFFEFLETLWRKKPRQRKLNPNKK